MHESEYDFPDYLQCDGDLWLTTVAFDNGEFVVRNGVNPMNTEVEWEVFRAMPRRPLNFDQLE